MSYFQKEYPELQLNFALKLPIDGNKSDGSDFSRHSPSSPVPYVDMNAGNSFRTPLFQMNGNINLLIIIFVWLWNCYAYDY